MTVEQDPRLAMQCRSASRVKTRQAWHAAVRHTGLLFQLHLPAPPTPPCQSDTSTEIATASFGKGADHVTGGRHAGGEAECPTGQEAAEALPYPQLSQTVSSTNFAPAAHLAEHYSPPGGDPSRATCTWLPCLCDYKRTTSDPCVTPLCFFMSLVDACQCCCVVASVGHTAAMLPQQVVLWLLNLRACWHNLLLQVNSRRLAVSVKF